MNRGKKISGCIHYVYYRFFLISICFLILLTFIERVNAGCNDTPFKTYDFIFCWGYVMFNGEHLKANDVIRAFVDDVEINNGCVGMVKIKEDLNYYQAMPIYKDDISTEYLKDGIKPNDIIRFTLCRDGIEYEVNDTILFQEEQDIIRRDLSAETCCYKSGWSVVGDFQNNMAVYGTVEQNGLPVEKGCIGAFGFDGETDCRALGEIERDGSFYLTIYGNIDGEVIRFKILQCADINHEYDCETTVRFETDAMIMKNVSCGLCTQSINMRTGWNWVSFYVIPDDISLEGFFEGYSSFIKQVKAQTRSATNIPERGWITDDPNLMARISDGVMFKIYATEGFTLVKRGTPVLPYLHIPVRTGWTWLAFFPDFCECEQSICCRPVLEALSLIIDNFYQFKGQTQSITKLSNKTIIGDLKELCPGKGYVVKMTYDDTLIYR